MRIERMRVGACLLGCLLSARSMSAPGTAAAPDQAELTARYTRAAAFLPGNASRLVQNAEVVPHWIGLRDAFWYVRQSATGTEFVVVDATNGRRHPAFDLDEIARSLAAAAGGQFRCRFGEGSCEPLNDAPALLSPDGKWIAFLKGEDLWLRSTSDGSEH